MLPDVPRRQIAIHGLGYVGLTAAVHFALAGRTVRGYDPDPDVAEAVNRGAPKAGEFLSYLAEDVTALIEDGRLTATTDFPADCETHLIAVPTERAGQPDDAIVKGVLRRLDAEAPLDSLVIVESTLIPGTIDSVLPMNHDVAVAPRRDWFADPTKNLKTLPRVVGGVTPEATERAIAVLGEVSESIMETDYRTAELTKSLENALLHTQVMFAYQFAAAFPDHNTAEALRLAGTHWRLTPLHLGAGTGGRCVPLGSEYLWRGSCGRLPMARAALEWDERHRKLIASLARGRTLILGIAYRPDFKDAGRSPGLDIAYQLRIDGHAVLVHDPMWTVDELERLTHLPIARIPEDLHSVETVILTTPHTAYATLAAATYGIGRRVIDTQGYWKGQREAFLRAGVDYRIVGEPGWMRAR